MISINRKVIIKVYWFSSNVFVLFYIAIRPKQRDKKFNIGMLENIK